MWSACLVLAATLAQLPAGPTGAGTIGFVPNAGQEATAVLFRGVRGDTALFATAHGFTAVLAGIPGTRGVGVVEFAPVGDGFGEPRGEAALPGRIHVLRGRDPARHARDLPHFGALRYDDPRRGVALVLRADASGLALDLDVAPGGDPAAPTLEVRGALELTLDSAGALHATTIAGDLVLATPRTFAVDLAGVRRPLDSAFELRGARRFGFRVASARAGERVLVDPGLGFASYLGASQFDDARAVAAEVGGGFLVAGSTFSPNFPVTGGAYDTQLSGVFSDVFVAKFTTTGALAWATYAGGSGSDSAAALALDAQSRPCVAGRTESADFPITAGAFDTAMNGGGDGFALVLAASGSSLVASTYLGGSQDDEVRALALGGQGEVFVTGFTSSSDFPVTPGAFDTTLNGGPPLTDAFVTRLQPGLGALGFSTFLGGSMIDDGRALAWRNGVLAAGGRTDSADFPATAYQTLFGGGLNDGFLARFDGASGALLSATFLGGDATDIVDGVALTAAGAVYATGRTDSANLPLIGGFDLFHGGGEDAFVFALAPTGAAQVFGAFLGNAGNERGLAIRLDSFDSSYIVGRTDSTMFPILQNAVDTTYNGATDAFFMKVRPLGVGLFESTYFGGAGYDELSAVAVDAQGAALAIGRTTSTNLPVTPGAFQTVKSSSSDAFFARFLTTICPLPPQVVLYGAGKAGTNGVPALTAANLPAVPSTDFQVKIGNGLPFATPLLFAGVAQLSVPFDGGSLLVNPIFIVTLPPLDSMGRLILPIPVGETANLCGATLYLQALWADPAAAEFYHTAQTNGLKVVFGS